MCRATLYGVEQGLCTVPAVLLLSRAAEVNDVAATRFSRRHALLAKSGFHLVLLISEYILYSVDN